MLSISLLFLCLWLSYAQNEPTVCHLSYLSSIRPLPAPHHAFPYLSLALLLSPILFAASFRFLVCRSLVHRALRVGFCLFRALPALLPRHNYISQRALLPMRLYLQACYLELQPQSPCIRILWLF